MGTAIRFGLVGAMNSAVDLLVFFLLTGAGIPALLAQVVSYTAGTVNSYVINRRWTFRVRTKASRGELWKFLLVNGLTLLLSSGLLFVLHDRLHAAVWFSKILATGGGMAVNYAGSRLWVFAVNHPTAGSEER